MKVEFVDVESLKHIEGFSKRRVEWLKEKVLKEQVWNKPLAVDDQHALVMDGQHRMEVARALKLKRVPVVKFTYSEVEIWSLRPGKHEFDWQMVTSRALTGDIYPYKTVKHRFPGDLPVISYSLDELR